MKERKSFALERVRGIRGLCDVTNGVDSEDRR
jgi:hypothetical protein